MANNHLQFQLQELNPPVPPQAAALMADPVPLEVRRLRVQHGSKRKRDLAAVRMAEELALLQEAGDATESAVATWEAVSTLLAAAVPEPTFRLWLQPLTVFAVDGGTLVLSGPQSKVGWVERRYSSLIGEALQAAGSEFTKVRFVSGGGL